MKRRWAGEQHRMCDGPHSVAVIAFDYIFISNKQILRRDEMTDDLIKKSLVKILVVKDHKSKAVFAHVVTQKGTDCEGYAVQRLVEDVKWLGYTKVLLKANNERAIAKLLTEALRVTKIDGVE